MVLKDFFVRAGLVVSSNNVLVANTQNNTVGINTAAAAVTLDVQGTDAIRVGVGNTAQRPTISNGLLRFNTDILTFEFSSPAGAWNNWDIDRGEVGAI